MFDRLVKCVQTHLEGVTWNGPYALSRLIYYVKSNHSPAQPVLHKCWQHRLMGTGSTAASKRKDGLFTTVLLFIVKRFKQIFQMIAFVLTIHIPCIFCSSEDPGYFDGVLLCKDSNVAAFVEEVARRANQDVLCIFNPVYSNYTSYASSPISF